MPIYEFKCLKCENFFELLFMGEQDRAEMKCPQCGAEDFERVLSTTSFSMSGGSEKQQGVSSQTRSCSSGSCTTYTIPGPIA